ncbi:MAG TPA: DUF4159 domain-containing protein, partial [Alphaproteobacteria bacterium]|nr:DUF4159 domain-containing protein [Alphaproteobacteria bacterium]
MRNRFLYGRGSRVHVAAFAAAALLLMGYNGAGAQGHPPEGGDPPAARRAGAAMSDEYRVTIARLKYGGGGDWYADPSSLPNLLSEFSRRTGIPTASMEKVIEPGDPELSSFPFLYMTGHGNVRLAERDVAALRRYLDGGGFLHADDNYGMDESFRREVERVYPEAGLVPVPHDHPIYHIFYELPDGLPKVHE